MRQYTNINDEIPDYPILGLPFTAPVKQTLIPVQCARNNIVGWIPIAATEFAGTETTFPLASGALPITTVTLPPMAQNSNGQFRVNQFMAAVFPSVDSEKGPWLKYPEFISIRSSDYVMQWFMPVMGQGYRVNLGALLGDLKMGMDFRSGDLPPPIDPPAVTPGTLQWAVSLAPHALGPDCPFFDFNWVELFNSQTDGVDPLRIEIVSNPVSGEFKTTVVAYQSITPLGGAQYNTLRIINLKHAEPGQYVFNYAVVDTLGQSTPVTLTLTVV